VVSVAVMLGMHSLIRVLESLFTGFDADGPLYFGALSMFSVVVVVYFFVRNTRHNH
jgi:hypothetical protein